MSLTACNHLQDAIYEAVERVSDEYTISHAEIVGVLHLVASGITFDHLMEEEE